MPAKAALPEPEHRGPRADAGRVRSPGELRRERRGRRRHRQCGEREIVGLIGSNGAGKSTLMNAIGGFVPASGSVRLGDHEIGGWAPAHRAGLGLGRTFQSATLFPELTVAQTLLVALEGKNETSMLSTAVAWPPATRRSRHDRAAVGDLVDLLGLGSYRDHYIADLSTGTRRVVELAGLLALDAKVLCLDEPTMGLAQRENEAFGPLIVTVRRQLDASVLLIEHDMPLIMGISDRVYCLEAGKVIAEGHPTAVRDDPRVIASYLGTDERAINRSGAEGGRDGLAPSPPAPLRSEPNPASRTSSISAAHLSLPGDAAVASGRTRKGQGAAHDGGHYDRAGHGMGAACAERMADMVDALLLVDRDEALLATQADMLAAAGHRAQVEPFVLDVKDPGGIARLAARVAELGALRAVAHAAGLSPTMADWREILAVNLIGTGATRRGVPSARSARHSGRLLRVGSRAARARPGGPPSGPRSRRSPL